MGRSVPFSLRRRRCTHPRDSSRVWLGPAARVVHAGAAGVFHGPKVMTVASLGGKVDRRHTAALFVVAALLLTACTPAAQTASTSTA